MKKKKESKSVLFIIVILSLIFFLSGLFAKVVPMKSGHGLSNFLSTNFDETKATEKTTKPVVEKKQPEVKKISYSEQVNQEIVAQTFPNRFAMPLLLQTDERWKTTPYGIGSPEGDNLEINGCAILSLAMVSSYWENREVLPTEVLAWSGNDYFMEGEGTAWSIFSEYANEKGYVCEDLVTDMVAVEDHVKAGHPVIVSVHPGIFTTVGHIMVISGTNDGKFWINDPNDSEQKGHSIKEFTSEELENEAVNFWAIYK
ncbi:peptidase C39 family protein [Enterococcus rivorum]|uniref:Peptidase C39-like domain-containing protein n=1 Tax=Enterococcus rivorum TaxID=762845 RepID=A0A1E5KZU9_9ENTE|nr:peptidase C39 family protein [Enterococcus rivorum]MBP2100221.1 hypothetical protein [Enterococcus rivorum]OEH83442.1 hypothetical protein BCR26_09680 [Enterococcus rivorum]